MKNKIFDAIDTLSVNNNLFFGALNELRVAINQSPLRQLSSSLDRIGISNSPLLVAPVEAPHAASLTLIHRSPRS